MKVFDWKRREADESAINDLDNFEFTMDNLKPAPGSRPKKTRKGRGISAGQGATCGFGMRGQKARSGRPTRAGFEGGQQPLYRRLPKFVGKPLGPGHKRKIYNIIKLDQLNDVAPGSTCNCTYLSFILSFFLLGQFLGNLLFLSLFFFVSSITIYLKTKLTLCFFFFFLSFFGFHVNSRISSRV